MSQLIIDLTGEMLLFGTLGKLLQAFPEKEWIQSLLDEKVFAEVPFAADHADVIHGQELIQAWIRSEWEQDPQAAFAALEADFYHLFIGPAKVLAPPWESVYANFERLVFQEDTLDVRKWYRKYGLQIEQLYHEPDDHIGLELAFLAHLSQRCLQALERQDGLELDRLMDEQRVFLTQHPLDWAPSWRDLVEQHARTGFYRGLALITQGALLALAQKLKIGAPEQVME